MRGHGYSVLWLTIWFGRSGEQSHPQGSHSVLCCNATVGSKVLARPMETNKTSAVPAENRLTVPHCTAPCEFSIVFAQLDTRQHGALLVPDI